MKPIFKNVTKYTTKNYEQFLQFHRSKYDFKYNFFTIVLSLMFLYCLITCITSKNIRLSIIFVIAFIVFLIFRLYVPAYKLKKSLEICKGNEKNSFTFSFYKFYFTVGKVTFYYFKLAKVFETDDYFYLYIDSENAMMLSKKGFKIGTAEDFSNFIKKKCFFKYSK